jgi:HPt (histidine-containing phosphotransfer) domain-containing protein
LIRRRCRSAGFDDYLGKPAARERIYAILHTAAAGGVMAGPREPAVHGGAVTPGPDDPVELGADPDIRAMLPKFFASRSALLAELRAALETGDRAAAARCAHKLAGGFALYGFAWASAESRALQQDVARVDEGALLARCEQLQRHIDGVRLAGGFSQPGGDTPGNTGGQDGR